MVTGGLHCYFCVLLFVILTRLFKNCKNYDVYTCIEFVQNNLKYV